jgi:magnesium chelatase subunit D
MATAADPTRMADDGAAAGHGRGLVGRVESTADGRTGRTGRLLRGLFAETADEPPDETPSASEAERESRARARVSGRSRQRAVVSPEPFRGRYARARPAGERATDIAWDATLRAAALRSSPVELGDLRAKVRVRRPAELLLFVVDASGSMGGVLTEYARRMAVAVLTSAYLKRATVAMIVFRDRSAELLLSATRKVDRIEKALGALPLGGTTPLAAGLDLARRTLAREIDRSRGMRPTLILISDGRANVGSQIGHESVVGEVESMARRIAELSEVRVLFLDTTEAGKDDRRARSLQAWLGAERLSLAKLTRTGRDPTTVARIAFEEWGAR